jgi:hypothetical protein
MVSHMTICKFVLAATAVALSGCASMEASAPASPPSLQNAVYVTGDSGTASGAKNAAAMPPGESKAMRFYWFLGGR